MKTKALLFNSPKNCGKTYAINYLRERGFSLTTRSCKDHLHELTMKFFNVKPELYWKLYESRMLKEEPTPVYRVTLHTKEQECLEGSLGYYIWGDTKERNHSFTPPKFTVNLSPREALIYISEVVLEKFYKLCVEGCV